jgi:hypothetical protein
MKLPSLYPALCIVGFALPTVLCAQAPSAPRPSTELAAETQAESNDEALNDLLGRRDRLAAREAELAAAFQPASPEQLARLSELESEIDLTPEQSAWMKSYLEYFADFIPSRKLAPPPLPADATPYVRIAKVAAEVRVLAAPGADIELTRLPAGGEVLQLAIIPSLSSAMVMLADGRLGFLQAFTLDAYDPASDRGPASSAFGTEVSK